MRCPACDSRKYRGNDREKKCERCGFVWKNAIYRKATAMSDSRRGDDKVVETTRNMHFKTRNHEKFVVFDYHDVAYKFSILKDNVNVHLPVKIPMNNWDMEQEEYQDFVIRRTSKSIIIIYKHRTKGDINDADKILNDIEGLIIEEAKKFSLKYGIELGEAEPMRKEVKLIDSFVPAGTLFRGEIAKSVYPNGQIEFTDPKKAMEHAKNFVENISLNNQIPIFFDAMSKFNDNFELHYGVLQEIGSSVSELSRKVELLETRSVWTRIYQKICGLRGVRNVSPPLHGCPDTAPKVSA